MENLLKPDYGVLALTILNFGLLVWLLKKFAWGPIISALEKREEQVRSDKQAAQDARQTAEQVKRELDEKLAHISDEAAARMAAAVKTGETQKEQLLAEAKVQAARLIEQAQAQIHAEKEKALSEVRREIAQLSILAAEQIVKEQLNQRAAEQVIDRVLNEVKQK